MKIIIILLLFISSILKADYLITNGEIALFYDGQNNILENMKSTELKKDLLSNLQILLVKDYKIYDVRNYYTEVNYIDEKNMFYMKNNINGEILETYILLSNYKKNTVYIYTDFSKMNWKKPYNLVYKFSPFLLEDNIQNKEDYYKYNSLNFSKDKDSEVVVASEIDFENFKVKVLEDRLIKQPNEKIYLIKKINENKKNDFIEIVLAEQNPKFSKLTFKEIQNEEKEFWKKLQNKYPNLRENVINQIQNFELIYSEKYAQNSLKSNTSRINYAEQLKVMYLNGILNSKNKIPKFNFKKEDPIQNIYTYYYYIKFCIHNNIDIKNNKEIKDNLMLIKDNIRNSYESIQNKEGNWLENSLLLYNFLSEIQKSGLSEQIFINIEDIKESIVKNVKKEILDNNGIIKNHNNIQYLEILKSEDKNRNIKKILGDLSKKQNLLIKNEKANKLINLNLALLLYNNGYKVESDKVFYSIDYFINFEKKYNELNLEEIYLYLINIQYRGLI